MKKFMVSGSFLKKDPLQKQVETKFTLTVLAKSENHAAEIVLSKIGSKYKIKRTKIAIGDVKLEK